MHRGRDPRSHLRARYCGSCRDVTTLMVHAAVGRYTNCRPKRQVCIPTLYVRPAVVTAMWKRAVWRPHAHGGDRTQSEHLPRQSLIAYVTTELGKQIWTLAAAEDDLARALASASKEFVCDRKDGGGGRLSACKALDALSAYLAVVRPSRRGQLQPLTTLAMALSISRRVVPWTRCSLSAEGQGWTPQGALVARGVAPDRCGRGLHPYGR